MMCIICVELIKQNMTYQEAQDASKEMVLTAKPDDNTEHYEELNRSLREADLEKLGELLEESDDTR